MSVSDQNEESLHALTKHSSQIVLPHLSAKLQLAALTSGTRTQCVSAHSPGLVEAWNECSTPNAHADRLSTFSSQAHKDSLRDTESGPPMHGSVLLNRKQPHAAVKNVPLFHRLHSALNFARASVQDDCAQPLDTRLHFSKLNDTESSCISDRPTSFVQGTNLDIYNGMDQNSTSGGDLAAVEKWLAVMSESLACHPFPCDRDLDFEVNMSRPSLARAGFSDKLIDRIYRGLFAYSVGLHELLTQKTCHGNNAREIISLLWSAYEMLLEQGDHDSYQFGMSCLISENSVFLKQRAQECKSRKRSLTDRILEQKKYYTEAVTHLEDIKEQKSNAETVWKDSISHLNDVSNVLHTLDTKVRKLSIELQQREASLHTKVLQIEKAQEAEKKIVKDTISCNRVVDIVQRKLMEQHRDRLQLQCSSTQEESTYEKLSVVQQTSSKQLTDVTSLLEDERRTAALYEELLRAEHESRQYLIDVIHSEIVIRQQMEAKYINQLDFNSITLQRKQELQQSFDLLKLSISKLEQEKNELNHVAQRCEKQLKAIETKEAVIDKEAASADIEAQHMSQIQQQITDELEVHSKSTINLTFLDDWTRNSLRLLDNLTERAKTVVGRLIKGMHLVSIHIDQERQRSFRGQNLVASLSELINSLKREKDRIPQHIRHAQGQFVILLRDAKHLAMEAKRKTANYNDYADKVQSDLEDMINSRRKLENQVEIAAGLAVRASHELKDKTLTLNSLRDENDSQAIIQQKCYEETERMRETWDREQQECLKLKSLVQQRKDIAQVVMEKGVQKARALEMAAEASRIALLMKTEDMRAIQKAHDETIYRLSTSISNAQGNSDSRKTRMQEQISKSHQRIDELFSKISQEERQIQLASIVEDRVRHLNNVKADAARLNTAIQSIAVEQEEAIQIVCKEEEQIAQLEMQKRELMNKLYSLEDEYWRKLSCNVCRQSECNIEAQMIDSTTQARQESQELRWKLGGWAITPSEFDFPTEASVQVVVADDSGRSIFPNRSATPDDRMWTQISPSYSPTDRSRSTSPTLRKSLIIPSATTITNFSFPYPPNSPNKPKLIAKGGTSSGSGFLLPLGTQNNPRPHSHSSSHHRNKSVPSNSPLFDKSQVTLQAVASQQLEIGITEDLNGTSLCAVEEELSPISIHRSDNVDISHKQLSMSNSDPELNYFHVRPAPSDLASAPSDLASAPVFNQACNITDCLTQHDSIIKQEAVRQTLNPPETDQTITHRSDLCTDLKLLSRLVENETAEEVEIKQELEHLTTSPLDNLHVDKHKTKRAQSNSSRRKSNSSRKSQHPQLKPQAPSVSKVSTGGSVPYFIRRRLSQPGKAT